MTSLTSAELEALATQCRDPSFRNGLDESPIWKLVATTLRSCLSALDASFSRSGGNSAVADAQADEDEDDGLSYSFKVRKGTSMDELSASDGVSTRVDDVAAALALVEQATSAFRFLRNACASSPANQNACRDHQLLNVAHDLVMLCCLWSDVDEPPLATAVVLLAQVALQFSVNAITGQTASQDVVWSLYFPEDFQKIMVECQEHRKVVGFTAALLLNCINKALDDEGVSRRRVDLVEARNLIITLLQRCLVNPQGSRGHGSAAAVSLMDDQDPAFEWLCLVFKTLFEAGYSKHLYNAVGAHLLSKLWSRVTPEQLILLRMFTMWMTSHRDEAASRTPGESFRDGKAHHSLPLQDEEAFEIVFEFVAKTWASIVSQETEDRPEEADTMRKQLWIELENEAKLLLLDVMGELTLARVTPSPSRRELGELLLQSLLSELQFVWSLRRLGPPAPPRAGDTTPRSTRPLTEPLGYRSAIIRVVGNLSYRHTDHQDLVRDGGFLPLFLNHCNIDESNPLLREWSLVALRNLCEGNAANQAYINELRPQGIDRSSVNLDAMNVDATLGEDGKLKVTRKPTTKE